MNIKLETTLSIDVPAGTKVIRKDNDWITLAYKNRSGVVRVFTCLVSEIYNYDLNDETNWLALDKDEVKAIAKL